LLVFYFSFGVGVYGCLARGLIDRCGGLTVMLSPSGRMLRLFPLKVVWRVSSLEDVVGAPSTAEAAVQSVRRVWAKCIFLVMF
jgi:hypothetical protein